MLGIQPTAATMIGASTSVAPEPVVAGVVVDAETAKSAVVAAVVTAEALGKASAPPEKLYVCFRLLICTYTYVHRHV